MEIKNLTAEKLLKYISLLSILFLLGGIGYNVIYYNAFNISIVDYIDLNELVTLFIPSSFTIIVSTILVVPILVGINSLSFIKKKTEQPEKKKKKFIFEILSVAFGFGFSYLVLFLFRSFLSGQWYDYFKSILPMIFAFSILQSAIVHYKDKLVDVPSYFIYASFYLLLYVGYISVESNERSRNIKKGLPEKEITFTIDTTTIKTDTSVLYIGETKNYIFTYNMLTKVTAVFPKAKLTRLDYKEPITNSK